MKTILTSSLTRLLAIASMGIGIGANSHTSYATPMDHNAKPVPFDVPEELSGYMLLMDNNDPSIVYVAPREGRLDVKSGMPRLSYAVAQRNGNNFGILNAIFDFSIDSEGFKDLRNHIKSQAPNYENWKLRPVPWVQTTPDIAVAGFNESDEVCMELEDIGTGSLTKQCMDLVFKSKVARKGPTLGEKVSISLVLTPSGVDIIPALLNGGAGMGMNLNVLYRAAHPAYTATIDVDYKKLYESYEWFAGYHDGLCVDIAISDFFERESLCDSNDRNANGRECSVRITYTDNLGDEVQNVFATIPSPDEPEENRLFYEENKKQIEAFHLAVETLQKKFEDEMLTPIQARKASVSKDISYGFAFRADRTKQEIEKHFTLTRKTVGGVITKSTTIPASTACVSVDGSDGSVSKSMAGNCSSFWSGDLRVAEMLPVEDSFEDSQETASGDFPFDL